MRSLQQFVRAYFQVMEGGFLGHRSASPVRTGLAELALSKYGYDVSRLSFA
jgi:hypothetical protein